MRAGCCSGSVHAQLGGGLRLFATAGAFLPPALQQAWEDIGVIVLQGYGATETAAGSCTTMDDHPLGCVGLAAEAGRDADRRRRRDPVPRPDAVQGLLEQPRGDGRRVHRGRLVQVAATSGSSTSRAGSTSTGARRTSSSCPTGSTCTRRTSRTRCAWPGIRDSVAVETKPGRIEVVVLAPGTHGDPRDARATSAIEGAAPEDLRRQIDAAVKAANATLGPSQRIAGWRLWPEADFPRTHTFKVKRDRVRTWATVDAGGGAGPRRSPPGPAAPCASLLGRRQAGERGPGQHCMTGERVS